MILHYSLPILNNNDNALSLFLFSNAQGLVYTYHTFGTFGTNKALELLERDTLPDPPPPLNA